MKKIIKKILPLIDLVLIPFVFMSSILLMLIRKAGIKNMPLSKYAFLKVGVFPILNHYYEPLFDAKQLRRPLDDERELPGINWNVTEQLEILDSFNYNKELQNISEFKSVELDFYINNASFTSGDAEFFYNLIRLKKPSKIYEIGSGYSTLLAAKAIRQNNKDDLSYKCAHVCIEPYEMPWLEKTGVTVLRELVENVDKSKFQKLTANDILFIDSSHIIRPQGDVLFEYLELLPILAKGVIVHIHDIFSPRDYLKEWVLEDVKFWNEQYLLEAFLSCNKEWKIIGAVNYLHHNYFKELKRKSPFLTLDREPGSFYIQKV